MHLARNTSVRIHIRCSLAAGRRQMAQEHHNRPEFVVTQSSFGAGHSGGPNTIVEDPLQLPIRLTLLLEGGERRNGRGYVVGEWDTCTLTIHSVAGNAVMRKGLLSVGPGLWRVG